MNARRKKRLRDWQDQKRKRDALNANPPPAPEPYCIRCGRRYEPRWITDFAKWSSFCKTCEVRNLHDGLGLPTPPELLDKYSVRPALSDRDFQNQLRQ